MDERKSMIRCARSAADREAMTLSFQNIRSWQKALLMAMCMPHESLQKLQDESRFTELMVMQENAKDLPYSDVWAEYCKVCGVAGDASWYQDIVKYEEEVLSKRV